MAKTMRNVVITGIVMILAAAGLSAAVLLGGCNGMSSESLEAARADAINAVVDNLGLKSKLDSELRSRGYEIVGEYGMPNELADQIIDSLAIEDWSVTTLPQDAVESSNVSLDVEGTPVDITTYEDTSVVTLGAYGQKVTFSVPQSAQVYVPYVRYLAYVKQ